MNIAVVRADARDLPLPDASVDLIVTSPPYFGLRDYGYAGQIGSEATPAEWLANLLDCTREWMRVLKPSGSIFVNLGDKYSQRPDQWGGSRRGHQGALAGTKADVATRFGVALAAGAPEMGAPKSLLGLPWRYALGCTDQLGLILRAEIIWAKPNGLPESVTDRVRRAHEQIFHFTRQPRYYSAVDEIREQHLFPNQSRTWGARSQVVPNNTPQVRPERPCPENHPLGKLPGSVWDIPSQPLRVPESLGVDHFAAFPCELPRRIILGWSPPGVCTACGEGRRPVSDKAKLGGWHVGTTDVRQRGIGDQIGHGGEMVGAFHHRDVQVTITGYACACPQPDAPTTPALVVDPFGGTGTTALVAAVLGRNAISFDLSMDYARLAKWRTTDPGERARAMQVPKPPVQMDGQDALFAL